MPNRILRDGFVDSASITALSDWAHRVYANLIVRVDDAGRFDGRLDYLRSHLFPCGTTRRNSDIQKALNELANPAGPEGERLPPLVILYSHGGSPFVQLTKVQRCGKTYTSRYPWKDGSFEFEFVTLATRDGPKAFVVSSIPIEGDRPPSVVIPPHPVTTHTGESNTDTYTSTDTDTKTSTCGAASPPDVDPDGFVTWWASWPKHERKNGRKQCLDHWRKRGLEKSATAILAALERAKASRDWTKNGGEFIPQPMTWLNKTPWMTDPGDIPPPGQKGTHDRNNGEYPENLSL